MSIVTFIVIVAVILAVLFLIVKTVQSVAKAAFSLALIGFILMVGIMIAFSLGLGDDSKFKNIKNTVSGIVEPVGKAFGFVHTTSRKVIDTTETAIGGLTNKNKTNSDETDISE